MRTPLSVSSFAAIAACLVSLASVGCATSGELPRRAPEPREPSPSDAVAPGAAAAAPLVVRVARARDIAPGELELELIIERRTGDPVSFEVQLPAGAELVSGVTRELLEQPERRIVRTLRLRLPSGTPADDLRVIADARGAGYGVRATTAYRFGRPAPQLAQPVRSDSAAVANGKQLGKPIPLR
jgi:hypothetical protein